MKSVFLKKGAAIFFIVLVTGLTAYAAKGDFVYNSKGNRDPFTPLVTEEGIYIGSRQGGDLAEEIMLEGIVWDPAGESMAIVNGTVVKEGDNFLNLKVLKIKKEEVIFLKGDRELIINLATEEGG